MASATTTSIGEGLRGWGPATAEGLSDESLLEQFLSAEPAESEEAFRRLVARHGPMVLGVCRHILDQVHDAEDAFQATFLVLARNAGAIRDRRVLARWLYEVAYRIALRSRSRSARRRGQEKEAAAMSAVVALPSPETDPAWSELRPVLHEEVNRLPEKYRDAVVLCYLEGHTNEEAAELLCWPVGTVKGRLSRARDMLRARLTRRGLAISATFLATRLSQNTVFAEVVPSRLADATTQAATALVRGGEAVGSAGVAPEVLEMVEQALAAPTRAVRATRTATVATVGGIAVTVLVAGVLFMTRGQDVRAAGASGPPAGRSGPLGSIGRAAKDSPTLAVDSASSGSSHCHIEEEPLTP